MTEKYKQIDVSYDFKGNRIRNFAVASLSEPPENPTTGMMYYDETAKTMRFYNGTEWEEVAHLEEGQVPIEMLPVMDSTGDIGEASDRTIPTTLLLTEVIPEVVSEWSDPLSDDKIPSEKLTKDGMDAVEQGYKDADALLRQHIDEEYDSLYHSILDTNDRIDATNEDVQQKYNTLDTKIDDTKTELEDAITQLDQETTEALEGKIEDVQLNNASVVTDKVAKMHTGDGLVANGGTISHDRSGITAGSYQEVTVDQMGHVTHGRNILTFTRIYLEEVD